MPDPADEMMDALDRWAWRLLKLAAVLLALGMLWFATAWWLEPPPPPRATAQLTEAEKRWINKRFRYHGITSCVYENGEHYFYRDRKKCKL